MVLDKRIKADISEKVINDGSPEFNVVCYSGQESNGPRLGTKKLFKSNLTIVKHKPLVQCFG